MRAVACNALVFFVFSLVILACGRGIDSEQHSKTDGFLLSTARWPTRQVRVCWEDPSSDSETERQWVKGAVRAQFNERTDLAFTGWRPCSEADVNANIRIQVQDIGPHTKGLGRRINQVPAGMVLNFTFQNWSTSCQNHRESCVRSIAVHEFGHAAGLAHEQNRTDRPSSCMDEPQGTSGDTPVGTFDWDSVMNYCNPVYNNNGVLSEGDIHTLVEAYGAH